MSKMCGIYLDRALEKFDNWILKKNHLIKNENLVRNISKFYLGQI